MSNLPRDLPDPEKLARENSIKRLRAPIPRDVPKNLTIDDLPMIKENLCIVREKLRAEYNANRGYIDDDNDGPGSKKWGDICDMISRVHDLTAVKAKWQKELDILQPPPNEHDLLKLEVPKEIPQGLTVDDAPQAITYADALRSQMYKMHDDLWEGQRINPYKDKTYLELEGRLGKWFKELKKIDFDSEWLPRDEGTSTGHG